VLIILHNSRNIKMKIKQQITQFNDSLASLKEFAELIEPFLLQRKESLKIPMPDKMMSVLDTVLKQTKNIDEIKASDLSKLKDALNILSSVSNFSEKINPAPLSINVEDLNNMGQLMDANPTFMQRISSTFNQDLHIANLFKNNLISLLSSVEWFFAQLLHNFYNRYPESPGINKKVLTFEDLKNFDTLKDAERYLIEKKIEELLRGSIDSWFEYLRDDLKIKINFVKPFIDELIEISQRRNLFVHNGGIVNTIYLSKVTLKLRDGIEINEPLKIDKLYVENSINLMQTVFTLLAAELWKKLYPNDQERGELLTTITFDYLMQGRWKDALSISEFIIIDEFQDSTIKTISHLNNWLSKKRLGNWDEISAELNKLDFSDKQTKYQLALASLKEDHDFFFNLLPKSIAKEEISLIEIQLFPIFKEMRDHDKFIKFLEENN